MKALLIFSALVLSVTGVAEETNPENAKKVTVSAVQFCNDLKRPDKDVHLAESLQKALHLPPGEMGLYAHDATKALLKYQFQNKLVETPDLLSNPKAAEGIPEGGIVVLKTGNVACGATGIWGDFVVKCKGTLKRIWVGPGNESQRVASDYLVDLAKRHPECISSVMYNPAWAPQVATEVPPTGTATANP